MEKTPIKDETTPKTGQCFSSRSGDSKPMSSSLRERLKRTRRTFTSPLSVVKRLKIEDDTQPQTSQHEDSYQTVTGDRENDTDVNQNDTREQGPDNTEQDLIRQCEELQKEVKQKSETLRRLKMVKMYRKKNDLTQLQRLIEKWRSCVQSVLYELQNELPTEGKTLTLSQLIDNLGLDDKILHFDRTEEDFTDT